jgi:anthranilate phosphoribosyltransferase
VLRRNGAHHVWAVHGADGMDELSTTGASRVVELKNGAFTTFDVHPGDAGLPEARLDDLQAGTPEDAAIAMRALLRGERGPFRDIVLLNGAAAFIVACRAASLREGAALAAASIDEGHAEKALDGLIAASADTPDAANDDRPNAAVTG